MRTVHVFCLGLMGMLASACGHAEDDVASGGADLAEATTPRKGSTINSPSVDATKTYWGARRIDNLVAVGYLTADEANVAKRADGIIANSPPNGWIGVDELASLESPAHVSTLFPAEKAVIPKLWKILELANAPTYSSSTVTIPTVLHDTYPHAPFELPIASLPPSFQSIANRIELTQNSDGDASTISGSDMEKAFADQGSYLPEEARSFAAIHAAIASAAPQLTGSTQYVEVATGADVILTSMGPVSVKASLDISPSGAWMGQPSTQPVLQATSVVAVVNSDPSTQLIFLAKDTGQETLGSVPGTSAVGVLTRVEVWRNNAKVNELDVAPGGTATAPIPFGYGVKIGATMFELNCASIAGWGGTPACGYRAGASGGVPIAPTSYYVSQHPGYRVDVFANGRALVVGPGNTKSTCYLVPSRAATIARCNLFAPDGTSAGGITFGTPNGTPSAASIQFVGVLGGDTFPLYAY